MSQTREFVAPEQGQSNDKRDDFLKNINRSMVTMIGVVARGIEGH